MSIERRLVKSINWWFRSSDLWESGHAIAPKQSLSPQAHEKPRCKQKLVCCGEGQKEKMWELIRASIRARRGVNSGAMYKSLLCVCVYAVFICLSFYKMLHIKVHLSLAAVPWSEYRQLHEEYRILKISANFNNSILRCFNVGEMCFSEPLVCQINE